MKKLNIKNKTIAIYILLLTSISVCSLAYAEANNVSDAGNSKVPLKDQQWWVGVSSEGEKMPLTEDYKIDMQDTTKGNQIQPLMLSNNGHVVFSDTPFTMSYNNGNVDFGKTADTLTITKAGNSLKEAYIFASQSYFPPSQVLPEELLFTAPQFNTWIELTYDQNQQAILEYARAIIANGFKPGVLMIDDTWQEAYGIWDFHPKRFPDPKKMMDELHDMGFKVMLWVAPFVSGDIPAYRLINDQNGFIRTSRNAESKPVMVEWWNGQSAVLDLSNPVDIKWFNKQLDHLLSKYNVDGFKFDAGDAEFYTQGVSFKPTSANQQSELYAKIGLDYPLNEYRATWKMGGEALVQRLRDKDHSWVDLQKLVPQMNLLGIMGYPFSCPDMIGGGQFESFLNDAPIDQELIVRSTQAHALMPMMQFSVAPWRILDEQHLSAVKYATTLREKFTDYILITAKKSAKTGEPIMSPMEYNYPHEGYDQVKDQFFIGDNLLVAPVMIKNQKVRKVIIPKGKWLDHNDKLIKGPIEIMVKVDLNTLPHYKKL